MSTGSGNSTVGDLVVLLLEKGGECGSVLAPVAFGPDADFLVIWLVERKLLEPGLSKVPYRMG